MSSNPVATSASGLLASSSQVDAIAGIDAVPSILEVCCRVTGMGYAVVAHVTEDRWLACAVRDDIAFGLTAGGELPIQTTLCNEVRQGGAAIAFDHASEDPRWRDHHTPRTYGLESYIAVPIHTAAGGFFGTLCAIDPRPAPASRRETVEMFNLFARLIGSELDAQHRLAASEAALLDARQTAELREQFIAVLGHDLRNPLASIDAGATMLSRRAGSDEARHILGEMQRSVGRMGRLIEDVLDFARGRLGGGMPLSLRPAAPLEAALQQVVSELRAGHPGRRIDALFALDHPVVCDPDRIAQLLSNLLSNAVTHGAPDQPVTVTARTTDGQFELVVSNGGEPIPEAARARLFHPFSRGSDPQGAGLGLGLYIVDQIARAHGGAVEVVSDATATRFAFRMPTAGA